MMMNVSPLVTISDVKVQLLLYFLDGWRSEHLATQHLRAYTNVIEADRAVVYPEELLEHYLASPGFTCCTLSIGLEITLDGRSWTDHTADHFWHVRNWFEVIERAKDNDNTQETTFVWDESSLVVERKGQSLILSDTNVERLRQTGNVTGFSWSPVTVNFGDFYSQVSGAKVQFLALCTKLLVAIESRGYSQQHLRLRLEGLGDKPCPTDADVELKCAIIARELMLGMHDI